MMKTKLLSFFLLTAILLTIGMISAGTLADWDLTTDGVSSNVDVNVNAPDFTYSSGVSFNAFGVNGINAEDWSLTSSIDPSKYFEATISPKSDYTLTISDINFDYSASITGPASLDLQYSTQSGFASPSSIVIEGDVSSTGANSANNVNIQVDEGETLTLRWFGYDFNTATNEFRIKDLNIEGTASQTTPEEPEFCEIGEIGADELEIKKVKITNRGLSDDSEDNVWYPLDTIRVEVELENNDESEDGEVEDIVFVLGLFEEGKNADIADEMFWLSEDNEEIEIGDIEESGEDDELTHTFEFRVNPEDLEEGKYVLKIKAYSDKEGEDEVCINSAEDLSDSDFGSSEYYAEIKIEKERENDERPVVVDVDELPDQIIVPCGEEVRLLVDVWNIGDEDQEQVKVTLFNEALGIDLDYEIREDMDEAGDKEEIDFVFTVPKDAEEKIYALEFQTYYDYDEDDDLYDERSKVFRAYLKVEGNCEVETEDPKITAELDPETPEAIAGKQVIIKSTIENTGDAETTYTISVEGYSTWSTLSEIYPKEITLEAGESEDVSIMLDLDSDAEGDKEFTIKATYDEQTTEQKVALSVEKSATAGITGAVVGDHIRTNWFVYLIAIINIILIIAIIAVVKSMVGRTPAR